jgi:hypothetical protein
MPWLGSAISWRSSLLKSQQMDSNDALPLSRPSVRSLDAVGFSVALAGFFFLFFRCLSLLSLKCWTYYQVGFSDDWPTKAMPAILLTAFIAAFFVFARFSFGYLVGFYLFVVDAGYFWLNAFSLLDYPHETALLSSTASIILFLIPALMMRGHRWERLEVLPARTPEIILLISIILLVVCALYGFRFVGLDDMDKYRTELARPRWLEYMIGNAIGAMVPLAIAWVVTQKRWLMASALCLVFLLFYPITLTKIALFAGPFLLFIAVLSRYASPKWTVVLSLLVPLCLGQLDMAVSEWYGALFRYYVFSIFNIRLLAIPSISLDHYYAFFSNHPFTHFCQISLLKQFVNCPYHDQLGLVMADAYHLGTMNASLLATEGVASVGPIMAPIAALVCGLAIAVGNLYSSGLPSRFVLISGSMIAVTLLNVPLSTTMLTNGYGLLLILWLLTPRDLIRE